MSRIPTAASHPRRAAEDGPSTSTTGSARDAFSVLRERFQQPQGDATSGRYAEIVGAEEIDENRHTLNTGLAAITVSALGLAVAGAISLTSNAQAASPDVSVGTQQSSGSSPSVAQPAPLSTADSSTGGTTGANKSSSDPQSGALDGRTTDQTSRSAARTELDAAMSAQLATERSKQLSAANDTASVASRDKAATSRSTLLNDSKNATSSQNDQLKNQAEQAKNQAAQANNPPKGTLSANAAQAAVTASISSSGGGATPLKPGTYTLGASFGAVGSWARYHTGQDFPAPIGTPIYAAADGVVAAPNGGGWAGTHVVIDHAGGGATLYAHMSSTTVSVGQQVKAGQQIGYVGVTGRSFGPHLHWEYYPNASTVGDPYTTANPVAWLAARGVGL